MTDWDQDQKWEADWWGDCRNTFSEENKQITYAHRMGLELVPDPYTGAWPSYDLQGRSVLDIGGGPVSLMLKARNLGRALVVDPCPYPRWTRDRYLAAHISVAARPAETIGGAMFEEVWLYNVLQHTDRPGAVVAAAQAAAAPGGVIRVFDWIDTPVMPGHPTTLTSDQLDRWFGRGTVEMVNENGCVGRAWYGAFPQ